ncbi:MAG: SGNH/GDSL hydrolase family protein [Planctomycetaceae bacterium]
MDGERVSIRSPIRLLAIGDCNTEGCRQLPAQSSLPALVAKLLTQRGRSVDVRNWGRTMSTTREGLSRVLDEPAAADVALINFGLVDAWVTTIPQIYIPYYPDSFVRKWGRKLLKMAKRRLRRPWLSRIVPLGAVVSLEEYRTNVDRMIVAVRSVNPAAIVVLWGTVPVLHDEERNQKLVEYNHSLCELAAARNAIYVDAAEIVTSLPTSEAYLDAVHLNEPALTLIARAIVDRLGLPDLERRKPSRMVA